MTDKKSVVNEEEHDLSNVSYVIDPSLVESQGRLIGTLLQDRHSLSCPSRTDKRKAPISNEKQIKMISKCCGSKDDFIKFGFPLKEIVFRLLLQKGNKPIGLESLHWDITEEWARPTNPMTISIQSLKRTLDEESSYGFREV